MVSPDAGCVQVDVPTTRGTTRYTGRIVDATPEHAAMLRQAGYFPASLGGVNRAGGRRCAQCGFVGYFTRCGRCGGTCQRTE